MEQIAEESYLIAWENYMRELNALIVMDPPQDADDRWDWRIQLADVRRARTQAEGRFNIYQRTYFESRGLGALVRAHPMEMEPAPDWLWANDLDEAVDGARRLRMQFNRRRRRT